MSVVNHTLTFINALESSPVHCLKPRPSGKRRKPGKWGAAAMLNMRIELSHPSASLVECSDQPSVDVSHDGFRTGLAMCEYKVLLDPCHQMVLEGPLDYLVQ